MDGYPYNKKLSNYVELKKLDDVNPYSIETTAHSYTGFPSTEPAIYI